MGGTEAGGIVLAAAAAGAAAAAPAPGGTLDSGGGPVMDAGALLLGASAAVAAALFFGRRWFRLAAAPRPAPLAPPLLAGAGLVAMLLAGPVGALAAEMLLRIERHEDPASAPIADHARLLAGAFAAQALAAAAIVALGRGARRQPAPPGLGPPRPGLVRAALLGAGGLFLFWPAVAFCSHVAEQLVELVTGEPHGRIAHETLARLADAPADAALLAMAALVVLGAPVLEEITYRGLLQRTLADLGGGRWPAIALTSAAFAAVHHDVARIDAIGGLFLLSLGLGWVYERSGRLIGPIVMHSLFNAGNLLAARAM